MPSPRQKITFLCREDFANVSTEIARAVRAVSQRWEPRVIALAPHGYRYDLAHDFDLLDATAGTLREATAHFEASRVVIWAEEASMFADPFSLYGSGGGLASFLALSKAERRYVFHAGVAYRGDAHLYNPADRETFDGQLCSPDLLRLANPGARVVWAKPIETAPENVDRLWEQRRAYGKIVVTHSPSHHAGKGTELLRRVMDRVVRTCPGVEYRELGGPIGQHLGHRELMRAREASVIHLDQYGAAVGGAGIVSFEAMARGTIPVCSVHKILPAAYEQWGLASAGFPLVPLSFEGQEKANPKQTERALVQILTNLCKQPLERLEARGRAGARWVAEHLSVAPYVRAWEAQLDALEAKVARRAA